MHTCENCGREMAADEPFASIDFMIQRASDAGEVQLLEAEELAKLCIPCGYDRKDSAMLAAMGIWLEEAIATSTTS